MSYGYVRKVSLTGTVWSISVVHVLPRGRNQSTRRKKKTCRSWLPYTISHADAAHLSLCRDSIFGLKLECCMNATWKSCQSEHKPQKKDVSCKYQKFITVYVRGRSMY